MRGGGLMVGGGVGGLRGTGAGRQSHKVGSRSWADVDNGCR